MNKRSSKKNTKKSSKKNTKKSSKKNSKKTIVRTKIIEKVKYVPVEANYFSLADNNVFQLLKYYKDTYEYIIMQSLEYKIEFTPINHSLSETSVTYFKKAPYGYNTNPNLSANMHIVGFLDGNVFTWNEYQKSRHYNTFLKHVVPYLSNYNTINSLKKLFEYNQITFPEKYRNTIPYLLSYMYDPSQANIIRVTDNIYSNHSFTFICIQMSLSIPYWNQVTNYISTELNYMGYRGGAKKERKNQNNIRLLKDSNKAHIYNKTDKMNSLILANI
jgi:hypothetical protein